MALACGRVALGQGARGVRALLSNKHTVYTTQVATLRATYGEPFGYEKPYPYEKKRINIFSEWFDSTLARMNENSKVIIVDGNVGVGKNEFAEQLAKNFDLKYFPSVPDSKGFLLKGSGFDLRTLNEFIPERSQFYDWANFLSDTNPQSGRVGSLQLKWYIEKFKVYAKALEHLFNTGQGVVIVRSPFTDFVFAENLRKFKYITRNFMDYYNDFNANSICELLKPHICIYLDVPIGITMDRIKERNNPLEVKSKIITEEYIHSLDQMHKEKFLPKMRQMCEVLEIDWTEKADDMDMEAIAEELQSLHLECNSTDDPMFREWYNLSEDDMCIFRRKYGNEDAVLQIVNREIPWECPEVLPHPDDERLLSQRVFEHPAVKYHHGWSPPLGDSTLFKF